MYKDSTKRAEELLEESAGLLGMIAEVKSKGLLLKSQNRRKQAACTSGYPEESIEQWETEVESSVNQMLFDLATYNRRLEEIYEELDEISNISRVDPK